MKAEIDIRDLQKNFSALEREHLPKIQAFAVNRAAEYVRDVLTAEIPRVFDRPVSFTKRSVFLTSYANASSNPSNRRLTRDVFLRDEASKGTPPVKYLVPEVKGGGRRQKRFEIALQNRVVGGPKYAVPARSFKLDAHGNVPASKIVTILSQLRALHERGSTGNVTAASKARRARTGKASYFAVPRGRAGGLTPGVYKRTGSTTSSTTRRVARQATKEVRRAGFESIKVKARTILPRGIEPVLIFTDQAARYTPRFDFYGLARKAFPREYAEQFKLRADITFGRFRDRGRVFRISG